MASITGTTETSSTPAGIFSILDTDLYKLTMQCAVHKYYPDTPVTYKFTNRTPHKKLSNEAFAWLSAQISKLSNLALTAEELEYLKKTCPYLQHDDYLTEFLPAFRFDPSSQVKLEFNPDSAQPDHGDISLIVSGLWQDTILYEIPLLALVSEAYFRFVDTDWSHEGQEQQAYEKGIRLIQGGAVFSDFGTRRRRDYKTQTLVVQGLTRAHNELVKSSGVLESATTKGLGKLSGTSNVHLAMKYGVAPIGTMAHEWIMGIAAATQDYRGATALALSQWIECYGRGVLGIALTDTFGTPAFLNSFGEKLPERLHGLAEGWIQNPPSFAEVFNGTRQDSGDPKQFIRRVKRFYDKVGITDPKTVVFSDSLTVDNSLVYKRLAEKRGLTPSFGIGTFLTNDFHVKSKPDEKSKPMNVVIKIASANGNPAIKLSDDLGKNTGDEETVKRVKQELGYEGNRWQGANEADRYGNELDEDEMNDSEDE